MDDAEIEPPGAMVPRWGIARVPKPSTLISGPERGTLRVIMAALLDREPRLRVEEVERALVDGNLDRIALANAGIRAEAPD